MFSDMSICSLTSANEINFGEIATKPTALFLQIPDEKETRHTLAAMVILQAYKALVAKAGGIIHKKAFVLAEGDAAKRTDISFLASIPLL